MMRLQAVAAPVPHVDTPSFAESFTVTVLVESFEHCELTQNQVDGVAHAVAALIGHAWLTFGADQAVAVRLNGVEIVTTPGEPDARCFRGGL